jgi:4-amino-4-deoxy-L-arabinose transferase-like glycosyltransferase
VGINYLRFGIFGILILSAFIRFWGIADISFTYDELSAIFRARAATWHEHWQLGVMPDGHPPGMQTLIWLWVHYFGEHAPLMHAAMAAFSVGSVYLVYKTAKNLTTPTKALATALFLAVEFGLDRKKNR